MSDGGVTVQSSVLRITQNPKPRIVMADLLDLGEPNSSPEVKAREDTTC